MPRTSYMEDKKTADGRRQLTEELRATYGGALTLADVMDCIGVKCPKTARRWVQEE